MTRKKKAAKSVPDTDEKPDAKPVPESDDSGQANTVPESDPLAFTLPDVSETAGDFVDDPEPETGGFDVSGEYQPGETSDNNPGEDYRGTPDDKGYPYDPAIHSYPPEKTGKLGKWKKKPKAQQSKGGDNEPQHNASYRKQAAQYAALYAHAHVSLFGKDGTIDREAIVPLVDSLEQYFIENGNKDLPPGVAVGLSAFNYSATIASRPPNKEKVIKWFGGVVSFIKGLFGKKKPTEEKPEGNSDAHSDNR